MEEITTWHKTYTRVIFIAKKISSRILLERNVATGDTYSKGIKQKETYMDRWRRKQKLVSHETNDNWHNGSRAEVLNLANDGGKRWKRWVTKESHQ